MTFFNRRFPSLVSRWGPVVLWLAGIAVLLHRALGERSSGGTREQGRLTEGKSAHNPKRTPAPLPVLSQVEGSLCAPALIALAFACLDELYQKSIPGRGFEWVDIGYDLLGISVALGFIWIGSSSN